MGLDPRHRNRSRKIRGDSRTIPLRGTGEDEGEWFTCWYCGWTNKVGRNALGGSDSRDGINSINEFLTGTTITGFGVGGFGSGSFGGVATIILNAPGATPGEVRSSMAVLDGDIGNYTVALKLDSNGNTVLPDVCEPTVYDSQGNGCSLCHSLNWMGQF